MKKVKGQKEREARGAQLNRKEEWKQKRKSY